MSQIISLKWFSIKTGLMMAPCAIFIIELLLIKRLVKPSRRTLAWITLFGVVASYKFCAFRLLGGNEFNPELPFWLIVFWGWMESVIWVGLPVGIVAALYARVVRPFRRFAFPTAVAVSVVLASYGMWEGVRVPSVVEKEVEVEELPEEFDGYRIAHISDLHCSSAARRGKIAAIVERTNAAKPDLVAMTGDFVDGFPIPRRNDLEPLKDLRARDGVFACTGNHEKYFSVTKWEKYYRQWGVKMLRNAWAEVRRGDAALIVGGIDDTILGDRPALVYRGAPRGCRILLQHRPMDCGRNDEYLDVRLQLSGHTHGGAMPILDRMVAYGNEDHVRGFYREGKLMLHVSPGTGQWAGFPLRFFNPPEITILKLRRRK